jgi:hypothetical protein
MKQSRITNAFWLVSLVAIFLGLSACAGKTLHPAVPITPLSIVTNEALIPAGWATHTSQQYEYTISYPAKMLAHAENPYSETLVFNLANPEEGARNFIYVSVITPEIQNVVKQGGYLNDVYNYDPVETEILLNMQVGESKAVREIANTASSFTYQRQPDITISGHTAQTYENAQPWEFPVGTKELRYYLSLNDCIYLIGGYVDTTGSNQLDTITEDLFHQILATVQLIP